MGVSKLSLSLLALTGSALGADLPAITMKGSKFFYENGTQFFMKGVAYQQDTSAAGATFDKSTNYIDPLADETSCKRDIPLLEELGTNTIRTYAIDPTADHSVCMKLLQDAGIYVISDLGEPATSINRDDPKWDTELFSRYKAVVDELAKYPNVIGFFAGNEVSNNKTNTDASAYVKAAVRDTKAYIKSKNYRWMGVGYAANDDKDIRAEIADYFNCGKSEDSIDFWGYNIYSWCGDSSMQKSGYDEQIKFFEEYSVPVFFAEYGCNLPNGAAGRIFQETAALYNDDMTKVFSGGIVYMYNQEANDYGLVKVDSSGKATKLKDFDALKKQVLKADPKGVDESSYNPTLKAAECPAVSSTWQVSGNDLPPTPDQALCDCMVKAASCGPASDLSTKSYGDMFGFICGAKPDLCKGINGNTTTGVYGAYVGCDAKSKLTYVLDAYYKDQKNAADACDFKGKAAVKSGSNDANCKSSLQEAQAHNDKVATATSGADAPFSTSSSKADEEDFAVPGAALMRLFSLGDYAVGLYMVVAVAVGGSMIAL
ncbi:hypothetical protein NLU13_1546 [Sarocladium strictum]|uniref:1,3-beta-glucanosyltransferase n=1 Tax=Sarocladium strictum TaxID=5046 RepID=A0AA39GR61_SARSR|nr:hypothetical protein NLU13_1546 [Sarocladium strictum]